MVHGAPGFGALITLALSNLFLLALPSGILLQVIQAMIVPVLPSFPSHSTVPVCVLSHFSHVQLCVTL